MSETQSKKHYLVVNSNSPYKHKHTRITSKLSLVTKKDTKEEMTCTKSKLNNCHSRLLYMVELSFKIDGRITIF